MAWEQIGTYESIPFWADDSLGVTDQDVQDMYLGGIQQGITLLSEYGLTPDQAFLKGGQVFVIPADVKDDPRWSSDMCWTDNSP